MMNRILSLLIAAISGVAIGFLIGIYAANSELQNYYQFQNQQSKLEQGR